MWLCLKCVQMSFEFYQSAADEQVSYELSGLSEVGWTINWWSTMIGKRALEGGEELSFRLAEGRGPG